jgi:hypothetical protein
MKPAERVERAAVQAGGFASIGAGWGERIDGLGPVV